MVILFLIIYFGVFDELISIIDDILDSDIAKNIKGILTDKIQWVTFELLFWHNICTYWIKCKNDNADYIGVIIFGLGAIFCIGVDGHFFGKICLIMKILIVLMYESFLKVIKYETILLSISFIVWAIFDGAAIGPFQLIVLPFFLILIFYFGHCHIFYN